MNYCLNFWISLKWKTQFIQFTDKQKVTKKLTFTIYRPDDES